MNIPFDRREFQIECERIARLQQGLPSNSNDFVFKNLLEVTTANIIKLKECQAHDSTAFYFNSVYTFLQGLKSLSYKSYSWATVQLYYSVFYSCKAILGFNNIGIIRQKGLHKVEIKVGSKAKPLKQDNDHKQTIKCFIDFFPGDFILSNNIDDQNYFEWIQDAREITNYRQQIFQEPRTLKFLDTVVELIKNNLSLHNLLDRYASNWSLYCFQEESALIAGSYKILVDAYNCYVSQPEKITVPEKNEIKKLIKELKLDSLTVPFADA